MSADTAGPADAPRSARGELLIVLALLAALLTALLPVLRVVSAGAWLFGAVALCILILATGYLARLRRLPAIAVSLIEAGLWIAVMTAVFFADTALLWVIPTPETLEVVPQLTSEAFEQITLGSAPLDATRALGFLIVGAMGLLTIIVDHVVLTARMPLLASVGIIAVSLIPAIAVPRSVDVMAFVLLSASILFLIRAETRSREKPVAADSARATGVPATALSIGAIAVVVALVATPTLPSPIARAGSGIGGSGPRIDANLNLGDDLRRPQEFEALRAWSDAPSMPYLRATTLTRFDGAVWQPDRVRTVPLDDEQGFGELSIDEEIRMTEYRTNVEVTNLASVWLPISYPAVDVEGVDGMWSAVPYNRTVVSQTGSSSQGQTYEVISTVPRPTLEQIRAREAATDGQRDDTLSLPDDMPASIEAAAIEVTDGTTNDYDALVELQRWFRSGEFRYSLDAPVEEGFDGQGADAVAEFLEVKSGYCIHYAAAFALMARTLDMPSRIVIGYLPGVATTDRADDEVVYTVASSQLHAWPEVYFDGVGWIAFEPTNSLGSPTAFLPAAAAEGELGNADDPSAAPSASATPSATANPNDPLNPREDTADGSTVGTVNPLPTVSVLLGILLLLAAPAIAREVRRRQLLTAAQNGDSAAAWTTVQDAAIDVGIAVPSSESPRAFAARLAAEQGASPQRLNLLVGAIERASYAPDRVAGYWHGDGVADAATAVRAEILSAAPPARRILAVIAPRSLIVRPGSTYAGAAGARARAR